MHRVAVYVDGFNLYYGMRASFGRRYHWLDLEALAGHMLFSGESLSHVKYFTARVRNDPPAERRQDHYLSGTRRALSKADDHRGPLPAEAR